MQRTKPPRRGRPPIKDGLDPSITLVKRYGNRRLYDTRRSRYVTLEELGETIGSGEEIRVVEARTGEDITKRVVTKIILHEEERRRLDLLPLSFLRKLLEHRDASLRDFYQRYLSMSLEMFVRSQREMARRIDSFTPPPISSELEELKTRLAELEKRVK